jgi:hypothetical protein
MSFTDSLRAFSRKSGEHRIQAFGKDVQWNGKTIRAIVYPLSEVEQMAGGYEGAGSMRCETMEDGVKIHDRIWIGDQVWMVADKRSGEFTPTQILTLTRKPQS